MIKFPVREEGQGLVEYALILVLVAIVVIAVLLLLGPQIGSVFSQISTVLQQGSAAGGQNVAIEAFSVTGTAGASCSVDLYTLRVRVTQTGQPASGVSVSASVSLQQGGNATYNGTTDSSGIAQWSSGTIGADSAGCGGRTATATAGGATATASY